MTDHPPAHSATSRTAFYPSRLSDSDLSNLYRATLEQWARPLPALACDVGLALQSEMHRRVSLQSADAVPSEPDQIYLGLANCSDKDVADALAFLTCASYAAQNPVFGDLIDHLVVIVSQEAAARLRDSGDERNAVHFWERLHSPDELQQMLGGRKDGTADPQ